MILLTGATGYVGGRLLKKLEEKGFVVRCLVRNPEFLKNKIAATTELVKGDLLHLQTLYPAMAGVDTAYYLAHSMGTQGSFEEEEKTAAANFANAARQAGAKKIIYLGGIAHGLELSPHLKSRQEVGNILRSSGVLVVEFQASIIIGSGSLSFEMIRSLMERLPVMTTPQWVGVTAQPISIEDVISYLMEGERLSFQEDKIFEIGGPDKTSYLDLMKEYGRQRGLRRLIIPVPVLTPWLSSLWLGLITPLYARIGRKLIESIRHETVVKDGSALNFFSVKPMPIRQAIERALKYEDQEFAQTRWFDASSTARAKNWGGVRFRNRLVDKRQIEVSVSCEKVFGVIRRIGGKTGWYYADWLWRLRGFFDLLLGGVGLRRGRQDPEHIHIGDVIDCWRVEAFEENRLLRLVAEMKLPGRAWLVYEVNKTVKGCLVIQTAIFDPLGLSGLLYWYLVWPFHQLVFAGMLRRVTKKASEESGA